MLLSMAKDCAFSSKNLVQRRHDQDMLAPQSADMGRAETTVFDGEDSSWTRLRLYASARGTFQGLLACEKTECNSSW